MFKTYTFFDSPIHDLHKYIQEIVWLWIDASAPFNESMITNQLLLELAKEVKINNRYWIDEIRAIYEAFRAENLTEEQKQELHWALITNNEIELLCKNEWSASQVFHYADLPLSNTLKGHGKTKGLLQSFFEDCYTKVLKRAYFEDGYESLKQYFDNIVTRQSRIEICPFCGLEDLLSEHHPNIDDFDHYLPKSVYPFSSVNFRNLPPMCKTCNRTHKGSKDPLHKDSHDKNTRRKVFDPFGVEDYDITVSLDFIHSESRYDRLQKSDLKITLICSTHPEEVITWNDIFDIEERYQAKICQKFQTWINSIRKEYRKRRRNPAFQEFLDEKIEYFKDDWFEDRNFLKFAIFSKMQKMGTLEEAFGEL